MSMRKRLTRHKMLLMSIVFPTIGIIIIYHSLFKKSILFQRVLTMVTIIEATPKVLKTLLKLILMTITVNMCFL